MFHKSSFPFTKEIKLVKYIYSDPDLVKKVRREKYTREQESQNQRIFMDKELTVAPFVITTSVFCCRKPETIRKTTPEPLLAEW